VRAAAPTELPAPRSPLLHSPTSDHVGTLGQMAPIGARQRRLQRDQTACSESREPASSKRRDYCSPAGGGVDLVAGAAAEFEESEHSDQAEPDCCIHEQAELSAGPSRPQQTPPFGLIQQRGVDLLSLADEDLHLDSHDPPPRGTRAFGRATPRQGSPRARRKNSGGEHRPQPLLQSGARHRADNSVDLFPVLDHDEQRDRLRAKPGR
jgi:hypothetical protein